MYLSTGLGATSAEDAAVPGKRGLPGTGESDGPDGPPDQDPASFQTRLKYSDWVGLVM